MNTNEATIRLIIGTLCGLALLSVLTICALSVLGDKIPPELNTFTGGLVGALSAMLVKTTPSDSTHQSGPLHTLD